MTEASVFEPRQEVVEALRRWGFGFDHFLVVNGRLEDGFRRVLSYCATDLIDEPKVVVGIWKKTGAGAVAATVEQAERFVLEADEIAKSLGFERREGSPPTFCNYCCFVGEPKLAWTRLGDEKDYLGRWCRSCRRSNGVVELDDQAIDTAPPPWVWLNYDRRLPEPGEEWPSRRESGAEVAFPFGANERSTA